MRIPFLLVLRLIRGTARRSAGTALCLALLGAAGCFRPSISDGGLRCSTQGKACPDGFGCDTPTNTCRRMPDTRDAAVDRPTVEVFPDAIDTKMDARSDATEVACFASKPGCIPQVSSDCDPVCRSGCACHEKCSVDPITDTLGCKMPYGSLRWKVMEACDIANQGTAMQTDNCDTGLYCLIDLCGQRCYQFCRADGDCTNATCTHTLGSGLKVCDVPFTTCDPVGPPALTSCGPIARGCFVSSANPNATVCDCAGSARETDACSDTRQCIAGLVCADANGTGLFTCRRVCNLDGSGTACVGTTCRPYSGSTKYGYCF